MGNKISSPIKINKDVKDCENWYRLVLSLELCVKPLLLEILHDVKRNGLPRDETKLYTRLSDFKTKNKLKRIDPYQWNTLCHSCDSTCSNQCPKNGKTNSNDFDITLIVALIRGLKILPAPKDGWSKPNPNDNSISASVARARDMRNTIYHASMLIFNDNKSFKTRRADIYVILQGLGLTDFSEFNGLEKICLDQKVAEKVKFIEDKLKILTEENFDNQNALINELRNEIDHLQGNSESIDNKITQLIDELAKVQLKFYSLEKNLQSEVEVIKSRIDSVANTDFGRTLNFNLILKQTSGLHFKEFDVKLNGPLHIHVVDQLQKYFQKYCDDIPDEIEITINEITPVENEARTQQEDKQMFPCIRFDCEVIHPEDPTYVYESLRDSLKSEKAKKIISDIETDLVSTIRDELHVELKILVRKWKVGSLLIDIAVFKMNRRKWENDKIQVVNNMIQGVLEKHFPDDSLRIHNKVQHLMNGGDLKVDGVIQLSNSKDIEDVKRMFKEMEGIKYETIDVSSRPFTETYKFNIDAARLIIGKKGSKIKKFKEMPGIIDLSLDTESSSTHCMLYVTAESQAICTKVYKDINKLINDSARFAEHVVTLIESKENQRQIVLKLYDELNNMAVIPQYKKSLYTLQHFTTPESSHESLQKLSTVSTEKHPKDFYPISVNLIQNSFKEAKTSIEKGSGKTLEFDVMPGKIIFINKAGCSEKNLTLNRRRDGTLNLFQHNLKPSYVTTLNPLLKDRITEKLKYNSFDRTSDVPEMFTIVHLLAGKGKEYLSVGLKKQKQMDEPNEEIKRISKAITVEDVLPLQEGKSLKYSYHKLCLKIHPDKCQDPGAEEAFKRLGHAYKEITNGKKGSRALAVNALAINFKPPEVLSVRKQKKKICTITTFSEAALDLRASIKSMDETASDDGLNKHVRDVLNICWANRDEQGGIQPPDESTGIVIVMTKQITAGYTWMKEIETSSGTAILEIHVNEIRQNSVHVNHCWQDCIEMTMRLIVDNREYKDMSAEDFTNDFLMIKNEWEKICPTL